MLQKLPHANHRALTWRYANPYLPLGIPLRSLTRRVSYRVNLKEYDELVAIGEYRLAVLIDKEREVAEMRELFARAVHSEERVPAA